MSTVAYSPRVSDPIIATAGQTDFEAGFPPPAPVSGVYSGIYVARLRAPAVVPDILTVGTDFSLINIQATTFSVRLNVGQQAGDVVRVFGKGKESRSSIYVTGRLDSDALEAEFVRQSMRLQEHARDIDRAMVSPLGEAGVALPAATVRANKLMGFGADGKSSVTRSLDAFDADVSNTAAKAAAAANSATAAANSQATTLDLKNQTQALRDQSQGILDSITPAGAAAIGQIVAKYDEAAAALDAAKTDALNSVAADVAASAASAATAVTAKDDTLAAKSAVDTQAGAVATAKAAVDTAKAAVDTTAATVNTQAGDVATAKAAVDTAKAAVDIAKGQTDTNAATATTKAAEAAASAASISIGTPGGVATLAQNIQVNPKHLKPATPAANKRVYALSKGFALANSAADRTWSAVAYAQKLGRLVAIALGGTGNRVMYSDDWGKTWTLAASADDTVLWAAICWSPERNLFVAVAQGGAGNRVMTSPDGITWTPRASSNDGNVWISVCWSPELGLFVAVAAAGSVATRAMWSADGITWAAATSGVGGFNFKSVCWAAELGLFVAVSTTAGATNHVMTSPDGKVWTARAAPDYSWESVCWSPWLRRLVAVASAGTNRVMYSDDGITWTATASVDDAQTWTRVIWADSLGLFYAVNTTSIGNRVMTSRDGLSWTSRATPADRVFGGLCWLPDAELVVAVANNGTGTQVMRSYSAVALGAGSNDDLLDRQWTPEDGVPAYLRLIVQQAKYNHEAAPINVLDLATSYTQRSGILGGTRGVDEIWADATASGIAQGRGLYLPGRKLYQTSANAILDNPGLGIRGEGMTIKKNGYGPLFRAASASDPAMTGGRLTVSPTKGSYTITLAPADAALLVANQVYVVTDRTLIFAATSTGSYRAEFIMPLDVNATTGVITLWWPLKYDYLAGAVGNGYARVVTPPFVDNVSYQDFNVLMDPTQDTSVHPDCNAFQNRWLRRHRFRNICVDNFVNAVVTDVACIDGLARDMWFNFGGSATTGTGDPTSTEGRPGFGYGYVQSGLNKNLRGHNLNGFSLRHVVDAGSLAHGDGSTVDYGEPLGTYYSACVHRGALNAAFGSHEAGQDFTLDGCIAEDFHFVGFQLRGRNMRVINCQAINGIGAAIWDRGGDSGNGYAKDTRVTNFKAKNTNQGTSFDGVDWTQWGAIMAEAHGSIYDDIEIEGCGGSAIMVGRNAGFQDQQFRNIKAIDICQKITTGTKAVINVVGGSTTGQMIIDGVESKSSDAKVVDLVNINSGVGAATIKVRRVHGNGHTGSKINNQSASAIVDYNRDTGQRIGREGVTGQYYDLVSDSAAHKLQTFSAVASAKPLQISVNTDASNTAPSGGSLGFDVYINGVRGIGCDTTGQVLQGGSVISDANRLGIDRSFTVATLPTTASSGARAFASNGRAFNGAGVQEGSGAGTGVSVTRVSSAWKITGTNVTVSA